MATNVRSNRIQSDKQYPKLSKVASGYLEIDFLRKQICMQVIFATIVHILSKEIIVQ